MIDVGQVGCFPQLYSALSGNIPDFYILVITNEDYVSLKIFDFNVLIY